jgi:hypothetical protein
MLIDKKLQCISDLAHDEGILDRGGDSQCFDGAVQGVKEMEEENG